MSAASSQPSPEDVAELAGKQELVVLVAADSCPQGGAGRPGKPYFFVERTVIPQSFRILA
jgi:hypothetical protein